jgi:pimeloyl-ACP methyl ester carboxylesterase
MAKSRPASQVLHFRSGIDEQLQPCAVCATDDSRATKALILEVSPGISAKNVETALPVVEQIAGIAARLGHSCVVLRPTGRGPGSIYQNYGEVDLFEALEHVCSVYPIDRDRITITGSSMGGAATWYLISHYPDVFAAAAPFCGYCDYRLWEKPGGLTFHMHPWEEPSWQSRSAALLVENLDHTPVWMVHGQWDRSVGGGVPVEHSLQMARVMEAAGLKHKLTVVPATGHGCGTPELMEQVVGWLLAQTKQRDPRRVALATWSLRHNRSYWVCIDQLCRYGQRGSVDARLEAEQRLAVATKNVRMMTLGPVRGLQEASVAIDGRDLGVVRLDRAATVQRDGDGNWVQTARQAPGQKRHSVSGPIGDLFHEPTILVPGTAGSQEETFFNTWVARHAATYFSSRNGGVHRGGIMGENSVELPVVPDAEISEEHLAERNLLLYGTAGSNAVLRRFAGDIPMNFQEGTIRLSDRTYTADRAAALAVFPHPLNPGRYVAVHGGVTPDAITWGSHLDMMLLPDYIVYSGGQLLDWGFWGNDWGPPT